jgi:superfamily II DNA/RNA helicase
MHDSRLSRIVELSRQIALLHAEERKLIFIATSSRQTEDFKRQAQNNLLQVRKNLANLDRELNDVESRP